MQEISMPHKIDLPLPNLTRERAYVKKFNDIILGDDYIEYRYQYKSEVENEDTKIWEPNLAFSIKKIPKRLVASLEYRYYQKANLFGIVINFEGVADEMVVCFEDKKHGQEIYNIIDKWLYNKV